MRTLHLMFAAFLGAALIGAPVMAGQVSLTLTPDTRAEARVIRDAALGLAADLPPVATGIRAIAAGRVQPRPGPGPQTRPDPAAPARANVVQRGRDHQAHVTQSAPGQRLLLIQAGQGALADIVQPPGQRRTLILQYGWPEADPNRDQPLSRVLP